MKMKYFLVPAILMYVSILAMAENTNLKVHKIDHSSGVITVSGTTRAGLKIGDKLYVQTRDGIIEIDVTFPMMSVANCKLSENTSGSALDKIVIGNPVLRINPTEDDLNGQKISGDWKEMWNSDGSGFSATKDRYEIEYYSKKLSVRIKGTDGSSIKNIVLRKDALSFVLTTSYELKYRLVLSKDNNILKGTVVKSGKKIPVMWTRLD